jgi:hypothetical protein
MNIIEKKKEKRKRTESTTREQIELKKPRNADISGVKYIHINSIPYEILGIILNECEEYSFVSQFICKHWQDTYKYLIQPEWNKEIQKKEGRKERLTWNKDKIPLSFLKWVVNNVKGKENLTCKSMDRAALFDDVEMIRWLREQDVPWNEWTCTYAAEGGHLEVLKWLKFQGAPWCRMSCSYAAAEGNLKILKYLKEQGVFCDKWTCAYAAEGGHLKVLKYLKEQACTWNEWTCSYAAKEGHLEVLKWLREQSCPWNEDTCAYAALGGHLEVLKWLREQGAPWNKYTCDYAARRGHLEVLKWLKEQGCPWDYSTCLKHSELYPTLYNWIKEQI